MTISQGATGTGNGTVQFSVAVNAGAERIATLTIAGATISITQRAAAPAPTAGPALSAPSARTPAGGQTLDPGRPMFTISNATATGSVGTVTYRFEVSSLDSFAPERTQAEDGVAQGGNGTTSWIPLRDLFPNTLFFWRARATDGAVTGAFSNVETFNTAKCTYTLTPASAPPGIGSGTFAITASSSLCQWTAVPSDSFITINSGASGTGNGTVTFALAPNLGAASRLGLITVSGMGGSATFSVTQDVSCGYNPNPNAALFTNAGSVGQIFVVTTTQATCGWSVASDSAWLVITAGSSNTGQGTVTYSVLANGTPDQRIGNIVITALSGGSVASNFVVTQMP